MTIDRENAAIISNCKKAARSLEIAWGKGDSQGRKKVEQWDKWFSDLAYQIVDMKNLGKLSRDAEHAALDACAAILALEKVPHWDHPDDISLIRSTLRINQDWDDYPEKRTIGFEESDDDEY